jgi:hypothetical protein
MLGPFRATCFGYVCHHVNFCQGAAMHNKLSTEAVYPP